MATDRVIERMTDTELTRLGEEVRNLRKELHQLRLERIAADSRLRDDARTSLHELRMWTAGRFMELREEQAELRYRRALAVQVVLAAAFPVIVLLVVWLAIRIGS